MKSPQWRKEAPAAAVTVSLVWGLTLWCFLGLLTVSLDVPTHGIRIAAASEVHREAPSSSKDDYITEKKIRTETATPAISYPTLRETLLSLKYLRRELRHTPFPCARPSARPISRGVCSRSAAFLLHDESIEVCALEQEVEGKPLRQAHPQVTEWACKLAASGDLLEWVDYLKYLPIEPIVKAVRVMEHEEHVLTTQMGLFYAPDLFPQYNYLQLMRVWTHAAYIIHMANRTGANESLKEQCRHHTNGTPLTFHMSSSAFFHELSAQRNVSCSSISFLTEELVQRLTDFPIRVVLYDAYYPARDIINLKVDPIAQLAEGIDMYHFEEAVLEDPQSPDHSHRGKVSDSLHYGEDGELIWGSGGKLQFHEVNAALTMVIRIMLDEGALGALAPHRFTEKIHENAAGDDAVRFPGENPFARRGSPPSTKEQTSFINWSTLTGRGDEPPHREGDEVSILRRLLLQMAKSAERTPSQLLESFQKMYGRIRFREGLLSHACFSPLQSRKYSFHRNVTSEFRGGFHSADWHIPQPNLFPSAESKTEDWMTEEHIGGTTDVSPSSFHDHLRFSDGLQKTLEEDNLEDSVLDLSPIEVMLERRMMNLLLHGTSSEIGRMPPSSLWEEYLGVRRQSEIKGSPMVNKGASGLHSMSRHPESDKSSGESNTLEEPSFPADPLVSNTPATPFSMGFAGGPGLHSEQAEKFQRQLWTVIFLLQQNPPMLLFPPLQGSRPFFFPHTLLRLREAERLDVGMSSHQLDEAVPRHPEWFHTEMNYYTEAALQQGYHQIIEGPRYASQIVEELVQEAARVREEDWEARHHRHQVYLFERDQWRRLRREADEEACVQHYMTELAGCTQSSAEQPEGSEPRHLSGCVVLPNITRRCRELMSRPFLADFCEDSNSGEASWAKVDPEEEATVHSSGERSLRNETAEAERLIDHFFLHDANVKIDPSRLVDSAPLELQFFLTLSPAVVQQEIVNPLRERIANYRRTLQRRIGMDAVLYAPNGLQLERMRDPAECQRVRSRWLHRLYSSKRHFYFFGLMQAAEESFVGLEENLTTHSRERTDELGTSPPVYSAFLFEEPTEREPPAEETSAKMARVFKRIDIPRRSRSALDEVRQEAWPAALTLYLLENKTAFHSFLTDPLNVKRLHLFRRLRGVLRLLAQANAVRLDSSPANFYATYFDTMIEEAVRRGFHDHAMLKKQRMALSRRRKELERREEGKAGDMGPWLDDYSHHLTDEVCSTTSVSAPTTTLSVFSERKGAGSLVEMTDVLAETAATPEYLDNAEGRCVS